MKDFLKHNYGFIIAIILIIIIRQFFFTHVIVDGPSMEPTLKDNNILLLNRTAYWNHQPKRFDIVIIKVDGTVVIKRIIGLPGETVAFEANKLYINNKLLKQSFGYKLTSDFNIKSVIPSHKYFVMGDNRPVSYDSRYLGFIDKQQILGRAETSLIPYKSIK